MTTAVEDRIFGFNQLDLVSSKQVYLVPQSRFDPEVWTKLQKFETEYSKYINLGEMVDYETCETLAHAFAEFQEKQELLIDVEIEDEDDEDDIGVDTCAMIAHVQIINVGTKHMLQLFLVSNDVLDTEDYDSEDDSEFDD